MLLIQYTKYSVPCMCDIGIVYRSSPNDSDYGSDSTKLTTNNSKSVSSVDCDSGLTTFHIMAIPSSPKHFHTPIWTIIRSQRKLTNGSWLHGTCRGQFHPIINCLDFHAQSSNKATVFNNIECNPSMYNGIGCNLCNSLSHCIRTLHLI